MVIKINNDRRTCNMCNVEYSTDNFYSNNKNNPNWIDSVCKECRKKKSKKRQIENKALIQKQRRDKKVKLYGVQSPFNYTGGKYKLLKQILPLFPSNITTFVDLFCGGCSVAINIDAKQKICNDLDGNMINFYNLIKLEDTEEILHKIETVIQKYTHNGEFDFNMAVGDFNISSVKDGYLFYAIVCHSFNQHPSYKGGTYVSGSGNKDMYFNNYLKRRLSEFKNKLDTGGNVEFTNLNFSDFNYHQLSSSDFVYCDPPYLITSVGYGHGWSQKDELDLLSTLDYLNERGVNFALSNVLEHKGKANDILKEWCERNKDKYIVHHINCDYSRVSRFSNDEDQTTEVLITNYIYK